MLDGSGAAVIIVTIRWSHRVVAGNVVVGGGDSQHVQLIEWVYVV